MSVSGQSRHFDRGCQRSLIDVHIGLQIAQQVIGCGTGGACPPRARLSPSSSLCFGSLVKIVRVLLADFAGFCFSDAANDADCRHGDEDQQNGGLKDFSFPRIRASHASGWNIKLQNHSSFIELVRDSLAVWAWTPKARKRHGLPVSQPIRGRAVLAEQAGDSRSVRKAHRV